MAVGPPAATVISYSFPESLIMSGNPLPQLNDFNASSMVSLGAPSFTSQSLSFNSYGSDSCCWDLYGASTAFGSTLFNNFPNPSMQQSGMIADSAFLYPSDDAVDQLFLLGNDSEFLQQINAGSTTSSSTSMISSAAATPVMHPNLVSTLKNMVTPGSLGSSPSSTASHPSSCSATRYMNSSVSQLPSFFDQQSDFHIAATTAFLRGGLHSQNPIDSNHNILLQSSVYPGEDFDEMCTRASMLSTAADEQITTHIQTVPIKQEEDVSDAKAKSQQLAEFTDQRQAVADPNEAAVVSVDLIQNRRPFLCAHAGCSKTFKNPQTMKMHNKTHTNNADSRGRSGASAAPATSTPAIMTSSSLKAGHNKKIPSRCPKCKKTFVGLYELRRHYGRKHSEGEKPFGCRKCGKKFYIEVDVRDHEKLCGEPIECKCGLKFAFKCNLVAHKKAHPACQDHSNNNMQSTSPVITNNTSSTNKNNKLKRSNNMRDDVENNGGDNNDSRSCQDTNCDQSTSSATSDDFVDLCTSRGSQHRSAPTGPTRGRAASTSSCNPVTRSSHEVEAHHASNPMQHLDQCMMSSITSGSTVADQYHHPEAHPSFKRARYEFSGMQYCTSGEAMWSSNLHYPSGQMSLMSNPAATIRNLPSSFTDHQLYSAASSGHDQLFSTKQYYNSSMQIMCNSDDEPCSFDVIGSDHNHIQQMICISNTSSMSSAAAAAAAAAAGCSFYNDSSGSSFSDHLQHQIPLTSYINSCSSS